MNNDENTRKRRIHEDDDDDTSEKKRKVQQSEIQFDFKKNTTDNEDDVQSILEKFEVMKQQLNDVKSLLSDKDISDWNKHTDYMNISSTIVPYLRETLNIEMGTQAWAKMFEILSNFELINHQKLLSLHLCEAPGAFISALNHFLTTRNETKDLEWQWFAQTLNPYYEHDESTASMLIDDDRLIFHTIDDNHWDFGIDNSGNIMNEENIKHYIARFQPMGINLITADGSFDVQDNPAEQELLVYPLLKSEVHVALSCLSSHGNFIIKFFTTFERKTIELIYLLYRTFRQISMFKPKTSKKGNSEMYVICIDFNRELFTNSSTCDNPPLDSSFLNQLLQCSQLFQSYQIDTIERNLHCYNNLNRKFVKRLHKNKDNTLDKFLDQCQIRELLSSDRHLLKTNLESKRLYPNTQRLNRIGTYHNQHYIDKDFIRYKIQNGFFCLNCSNNESNELCAICQILSQIVSNQTLSTSSIHIGQLNANQPAIIDFVHGKKSKNIRNSCFCNRYLLELCHQIDICHNDDLIDLQSIRNPSSIEISEEQFEKIQQFVNQYQLNFQSKSGVYYIQSSVILSRLQASVLYILTRIFQQTSVYIIPSTPYLLFIFEIFQNINHDEYEKLFSSPTTSTLLQFIHIHQLLDEHFAFNLIQANNLYLQIKYIKTTLTT